MYLLNMPYIRVLDMTWQQDDTKIVDPSSNFSITMSHTLEILDISNNHLPQIPVIVLVTPVNLRLLRAVDAGISNITEPIYCRHTPMIHEIDVTNNSINFIHHDVFTKCDWTSIVKLRMSGNMLRDLGIRPFFKSFSGLVVRTLIVTLKALNLSHLID